MRRYNGHQNDLPYVEYSTDWSLPMVFVYLHEPFLLTEAIRNFSEPEISQSPLYT
jgi:hypothetical protein